MTERVQTSDDVPGPIPAAALPRPAGKVRWIVCGFLFVAVALSYIDRLVISVLKPDLALRYHWTEQGYADMALYFQLVYGLAYVVSGRVIDRIGARAGYAFAMGLWTLGHLLHIGFTSTTGMIFARIPLAAGEAATFPAALVATGDWFPRRERALAIGIFNAGSNVGAIVTPLIVPYIVVTLNWGWRAAFLVTGAFSIMWIVAWLAFYRRPREHPMATAQEIAWIESEPAAPQRAVRWREMFRHRQAWAYMVGRFMIDPIWWTFLFWLPDFFAKRFGLSLSEFGPPLVAFYVTSDIGSVVGGLISSRLLARGMSVNRSRKTAMALMALCAVPIAFATVAPNMWVAVGLIGLACAGHQGFSANLFALPADLFPRGMVGSVIGIGGLAGALGGMAMAKYAGIILATVGSYQPIFAVAACAYLLALLAIHLIAPRYAPAVFDAGTDAA